MKKVQFGRPVEHIDFRDAPRLYETVSLETAVHVWTNTAHEGTTRGLKQHSVFGVSMLERLFSDPCSEMKLCALYFSQQITKREFKDGMRALISDDFVFTSFQIALRRMRTDKKITKMVSIPTLATKLNALVLNFTPFSHQFHTILFSLPRCKFSSPRPSRRCKPSRPRGSSGR